MISWRGIALLITGIGSYSLLKDRMLIVAIALEVLPLLLIGVDWFITPGKPMFSARRDGPVRYVIGRPNSIDLVIENRAATSVAIQVRDDSPQTWVEKRPQLTGRLGAGETIRLRYDVVPPRRGIHTFGRIHMRVWGRLGLIIRQFQFDVQEDVNVLPDVRQISEEQLLARTARIRPSDRVRRIIPGRGTEFARVREYNIDDDFRHVNWKATAKWGRPMVNEFEVTRNQTVMIAIDASRLSQTVLSGLSRLDRTINAAIRLAYVSVQSGDRVGVVVFADRVMRLVPPDGGTRVLKRIVQTLSDVEPELVDPDYPRAFGRMMQLESRRSLVCLFTDVVESWTGQELCGVVHKTSKDHLVTCLTMADPEVLQAAYAEPKDSKTFYQKAAALEIRNNRQATLKKMERNGAIVVDSLPWELATETINTYLALKAKAAV